jgi:hypothetical protein
MSNNIVSDIGVPFSTGQQSVRERFLAKIKLMPPNTEPNTIRVFLVREPFDDFYLIVMDDGKSEELEEDDVRKWLTERGADEDLVQRSVDQAWNFYSAAVIIRNPRTPPKVYDPVAPNIE